MVRVAISGNDNDRHVVPNDDGGWDVVKEDHKHSSGHFDTQAEAISRAREIVRNAGGGELVVHDQQGKIREEDTVPPGKDPFPPSG